MSVGGWGRVGQSRSEGLEPRERVPLWDSRSQVPLRGTPMRAGLEAARVSITLSISVNKFDLYQSRTDSCYLKGSSTTVILKDLFIATLGIEPNLTDHETVVRPLHYFALKNSLLLLLF